MKKEADMTPFSPDSIILYVNDVALSTEFYRQILDKDPLETFEDFTVFALTDRMTLGLQAKDAIDPKAPAYLGGFELCLSDVSKTEVDAVYAEWKKRNIAMLLEPTTLAFGYTFVALDPDGHRLRVCATDTTNIAVM
jgi:predicted lactoylglutathione lyase